MLFAARLALLFAVLVAATAPQARADDLSSLFDRMRARSGPVWRSHLTSSSTIAFGRDATAVRSESLGLRFSTYECAGNLCDGSYFDGERIYAININGTRLPQSDATDPFLRGERCIASLLFLAPDFDKNGGRVADGGTQTIDGARYRVVIVSIPDASPMRVFVDTKTATVRYLQDLNADSTFEYRDYRSVDGGLYLPFVVLRNGDVLERYEARGITTDEFRPPHGLIPTFAGASAVVTTNQYRSVPVFSCEIGGVKTTCLLDSGNSGLAISATLAKQLHAPLVGSFFVRGLGNVTTDVVRAGDLRIGNASYGPANYVVLHDIERFGYQVVLGADILASTTIALDPVAHTITFGAPLPGNASSVRLVFQNFVPVLTVRLGNLGTQLALDTGDDSTINLAYQFYSEHRDLFSVTEQRPVSGIGGTSTELIGTIPKVQIGDISMAQQPIGTTTSLRGTAFGHLGAGFIEQFRVVIDYADGTVYFTPTPPPSP